MARYFRPPALSQRHDPSEPHLAHENSNCTMVSAAEAVRAVTLNLTRVRGGNMRHHQRDQDGPTGLDDAQQAAAHYGVRLWLAGPIIPSTWAGIKAARAAGRFLILQGDSGDLDRSCSEGQDVAHAVGLHPDDGPRGEWLIVDPWCYVAGSAGLGKWRWIDRDSIWDYAHRPFDFAFAYTKPLKRIA